MKKALVVTNTLTIAIIISACGRVTPVANDTTGTSQQSETTKKETETSVDPNLKTVEGTYEPPPAGVKVTSANTVIPGTQVNKESDKTKETIIETPEITQKTKEQKNTGTYIVKEGDTLSQIANVKYGIKIAELRKLNNLTNEDEIKPGQTLKVPTK